MKRVILFIALTAAFTISHSQILIDQTVQLNLLPNMFLGNDYEISNVTFSGSEEQIGIFFGNGSNLSLDIGLSLGTGNVNLATSASASLPEEAGPGGNNNGGGSLGGGNFGVSDNDLDLITGY